MKTVSVNPEVTVAIVFYNAMPHFRSAVASVFMQTFRDWELLLLDDGSTDGSLEFAQSLTDSRVKVYSDGKNLKLNVRLNQSIALSTGRFYFRMDADDIMFPDRVEKQLGVLRGADVGLVLGARAVCIDRDNNIIGFRRGNENPRSALKARHAFVHPSVCAHTDWFRRNLYSQEFLFHRSQDAELWVRVYRSSIFRTCPEPLIFYRENLSINVENYLGSALGMCAIANRARDVSFAGRMVWVGFELLRCWLICIVSNVGLGRWVVGLRNRRLDPKMLVPYQRILAAVLVKAKEGLT